MVPEILAWYNDLNLDRLRIERPSKFLFLCGGARQNNSADRAANLRDYILRVRPIKTKYKIVLAEKATQLYRDTSYDDLITFEEDIARIAAVVLVIAESAGSLAELGAFASSDTIRPALRVVIPSHHETAESFVRYGPVQRIKNIKRDYLGVYPWKTHKNGLLNISSVKPHYREMVSFINGHLDDVPESSLYRNSNDVHLFYIIYWIIHVSLAITPATLYGCVRTIKPGATDSEIRNKIYCMQVARWIERYPYSGKDYFFACLDREPFEYNYNPGVQETSAMRRKLAVQARLKQIDAIPRHVSRLAASVRVAAV